MSKDKGKIGSGSKSNSKSTSGGAPIINLIQKLRRLDARGKGSGNSHVSTSQGGMAPPSSIEMAPSKGPPEPGDCLVFYEPHDPKMEGKLTRTGNGNAYQISTKMSPRHLLSNGSDGSAEKEEQTLLRTANIHGSVSKSQASSLLRQAQTNQSNISRTSAKQSPFIRHGSMVKSAFTASKPLVPSSAYERRNTTGQLPMPEDSGVDLDSSQGGASYSSDAKNQAHNFYETKRAPSRSAEDLSDRLSPSVSISLERGARSAGGSRSIAPSPQPSYEFYDVQSHTTYLETGSLDSNNSTNAITINQRLERIKRERKDENSLSRTKSPSLHDAQIIVHTHTSSRSEVLQTPIKDINICPVHGKYSYTHKENPETQEVEHTYVNEVIRDRSSASARLDNKLNSRNAAPKSRVGSLARSQGRNPHKLSDLESDMESISGVSATSQEVAHITSVLRRKRITHTQASKMRAGKYVSKTGYIDMRGGRKSRNKDKPNGMSKSLASFAEQSILSFLSNCDGDEASDADQQAYEHSTREFEHTTPSPPESHDEAGGPVKRGQHDRTPTNVQDESDDLETLAHPTLHDVASSYDLLAFTLGKSGYKCNTFGIQVSKCPFLDATPSPSSAETSPHGPRSRLALTGSSFSRRSRPSDSGLALVVVDSLDEQGIAAYDGRIHPGDYVIEVNGHVTLEETEAQVARLIESEAVLNLVVARARGKVSIAPGRRS